MLSCVLFWKLFSTPSIYVWTIKTIVLIVKGCESLWFIQVCRHSVMTTLFYTDCSVNNVIAYSCVVQAERCCDWFVMLTWQGSTLSNLALLFSLTRWHAFTILQYLVCRTIIWFTIRRWDSHACWSLCNS